MEGATSVVAFDSDWASGRWRNILVLVWRGQTNFARAKRAIALAKDMAAEHAAAGMGIIIVVESKALVPDADARPVFVAGMRECGPSIRGAAYVVTASGFGGAAIRAAISGLSLVAREPYPTRVFATPNDAAKWLSTTLRDVTPEQIVTAVERVRAA